MPCRDLLLASAREVRTEASNEGSKAVATGALDIEVDTSSGVLK